MDKETNNTTNQQSAKTEEKSSVSQKRSKIILVVLACLIVSFFGGWVGGFVRVSHQDYFTERKDQTETARQIVTEEGQLISSIASDVGPSVVSINVVSQPSEGGFFGLQTPGQQSAGTGFIISEDGYIVTNRHVLPENATDITITLDDGTELDDIEIVGRTNPNDTLDIAFLRINDNEGKDLQPVALGDSSESEVGEMVVAIGNALGQFQNTVTSGILSGYGRDLRAQGSSGVETLQNLFQTDAAINQGNSGGPLVNANGEVIAVNTAVAGGDAENIGFAIPINDVKGLIESVLERGVLERPYLGVRYVMLTNDLARQFELDQNRGAYIVPPSAGQSSIQPDSPADRADLQEGDIIISVDDIEMDERNSLASALGRKSVGDTVTLTIIRDGSEQTVDVTLEALPQD